MAYKSLYKDIIFIEGPFPSANSIGDVEADLSFVFGAQLKSLRDIKDVLAKKALLKGANAVINFTYGQKSRWLAIDDVAFWGKGILAVISDSEYDELVSKINQS